MTIKQLISILSGFPEDTIIAHEKYIQREYDFNKKRLTFKD